MNTYVFTRTQTQRVTAPTAVEAVEYLHDAGWDSDTPMVLDSIGEDGHRLSDVPWGEESPEQVDRYLVQREARRLWETV